MNGSYFMDTHGDPLGAVQSVIATAWDQYNLDHLMVSINGSSKMDILDSPDQLNLVNPFRPLMTKNAAKHIPNILEENPGMRFGVVLRPCEMRALTATGERNPLPPDRLLTICVDCLGTYPVDDYQWRAERKGSQERLAWESLHFARQGGIAAYRYRSACQACRTPISSGADINIGVIGLPVRQKIMLETSESIHAANLAGEVEQNQSLLEQREYIITKLLERGLQTRQRLIKNLDSILPGDVDALIQQFALCGECRECFDSCPLCTAEYPAKDESGHYHRRQVKEWMISCAGCGMCEQACPNHLPLVTIFNQIREQLIDLSEPIH